MIRKAETKETDAVLERAASLGREFLAGLAERRVGPPVAVETLGRTLGGLLPDAGEDPRAVVEALARGADPGIVASAGPRYFGFVTGSALPAAVGADWLTSAWDQNAWTYVASPAASVVEEIAGRWLVELLGLPPSTGVGFTTGATMASFAALAAARGAVLARCRRGVAELVERCCALARRMADALRVAEEVEVLNEVVLNQVLVRFRSPCGNADAFTREVIRRIQADGTCWLGGTIWRGRAAARISISNASTTEADIDSSAAAILACVRAAAEAVR